MNYQQFRNPVKSVFSKHEEKEEIESEKASKKQNTRNQISCNRNGVKKHLKKYNHGTHAQP